MTTQSGSTRTSTVGCKICALSALALLGLASAARATVSVTVRGSLALTEAASFNGVVADVTDSRAATAGELAASIDWGDGTTAAGTVAGSGPFTVSGMNHVYADEGVFAVKVTVTDTVDQSVGSGTQNETVAEGDVLAGNPVTIEAARTQPFNGTVATFSDTNTNADPHDFTATILWGDASASLGSVVGVSGFFTVAGTHTYSKTGTFPVTVTLKEDGAGTATAQAMSTATVGPAPGACAATATTLCLNNSRFAVTVVWRTQDGRTGPGMAVPLTSDTGYFWFFNAANVEEVVKVLNACTLNSHYWVFAGGLTNVRVTTTVFDTVTRTSRVYGNAQNTPFQPLQDTSAFPDCP